MGNLIMDNNFFVNVETGESKSIPLSNSEQSERDKFVKDWNDGADDRAMDQIRLERNAKLAESDWMANSDVTMSDAWKSYRQSLRDLPSTISDPTADVTWPTAP